MGYEGRQIVVGVSTPNSVCTGVTKDVMYRSTECKNQHQAHLCGLQLYRSFIRLCVQRNRTLHVTSQGLCVGETGHADTDQSQIAKIIRLIFGQACGRYPCVIHVGSVHVTDSSWGTVAGRWPNNFTMSQLSEMQDLISPLFLPRTSAHRERGNAEAVVHAAADTTEHTSCLIYANHEHYSPPLLLLLQRGRS